MDSLVLSDVKRDDFFDESSLPASFRNGSADLKSKSTTIDLRVGTVLDDTGNLLKFRSVSKARRRLDTESLAGYAPTLGEQGFRAAIEQLLFSGWRHSNLVTAQTIGGCGALRLGAEFIAKALRQPKVLIAAESWGDHQRIFDAAGFEISRYPYLAAGELDFSAFKAALGDCQEKTVILLQACSHNPSGIDLNAQQWREIADICKHRKLLPFMDVAYAGYVNGLPHDLVALQIMKDAELEFLTAFSCCKSFAMPSSRVGAVTINLKTKEACLRAESLLTGLIRCSYSSPPREGAAIIAHLLCETELRREWIDELTHVAELLSQRRSHLHSELFNLSVLDKFPGAQKQQGIFFYPDLSKKAVVCLREQHDIHTAAGGRVSLGSLLPKDVPRLAQALAHAVSAGTSMA